MITAYCFYFSFNLFYNLSHFFSIFPYSFFLSRIFFLFSFFLDLFSLIYLLSKEICIWDNITDGLAEDNEEEDGLPSYNRVPDQISVYNPSKGNRKKKFPR